MLLALLCAARVVAVLPIEVRSGALQPAEAFAGELGGELTALDINPLICGPAGALAVDVLIEQAAPSPHLNS